MPHPSPNRREAILQAALLAAASQLPRAAGATEAVKTDEKLPKVRTLTKGPKHHWFGYYDKLEFDPTSRYVLGNEVDFEHRSPTAADAIRVGMVDLKNEDRWIDLGESKAWSWQQGCMLQWVPGSKQEVIWNDRAEDRFVSRLMNVETRETRTLDEPIYALSPDGRTAISTDFRRLNDVRPGYGYAGLVDPHRDEATPEKLGVKRVDLTTGKVELLFSIKQISQFGTRTPDMDDAKHWFNHLLFAPDGKRFTFLHRWRPRGVKNFMTRMVTANIDGTDPFIIDPSGYTSHFDWRDGNHILAWTRPAGKPWGFYLLKDKSDVVEAVGPQVMTENGHCTYLPNRKWILNDTYPDKARLQHPYLYRIADGARIPLGHFHTAPAYTGEWRCDTHPRFDPSGNLVVIDSPHTGAGRQLHLIDISEIVKG